MAQKSSEYERRLSAYELVGYISRGTHGEVSRYRRKPNDHSKGNVTHFLSGSARAPAEMDSDCVIKFVRLTKSAKRAGLYVPLLREVSLLQRCDHPHVCPLRECIVGVDENLAALVFDYAEFDLHAIVKQSRESKTALPLAFVRAIMLHMLRGVEYIHLNGILHRDIKPSNILIRKGCVQIADFGLSRMRSIPPDYSSDAEVVSLWYRAPELLLGSTTYGPPIDVWACGCILYELLCSHGMFEGREVARTAAQSTSNSSGSSAKLSAPASASRKRERDADVEPTTKLGPFEVLQFEMLCSKLGVPTANVVPDPVTLPHWSTFTEHCERHASNFRHCFSANDMDSQRKKIAAKIQRHRGLLVSKADPVREQREIAEAIDLIMLCLRYDPTKRVSASEALQHVFFSPELLIPKEVERNVFAALTAEQRAIFVDRPAPAT
jgi:serine/threonine protein kinase